MPRWIAEPTVVAALVSAVVALIGAIASYQIARRGLKTQVKLKKDELDTQAEIKRKELDAQAELKRKELDAQAKLKGDDLDAQARDKSRELEALAARLRVEQEALRQAQLTEILKKRIETYPALYEIISVYGRNWDIEGKARDHIWATAFLKALIDNNAKNGAFFSERVYQWYGELRTFLEELRFKLASGREATDDEIERIYDIIRGPRLPKGDGREPGLGSYIKDELGSYIIAIVSATHSYPATRN